MTSAATKYRWCVCVQRVAPSRAVSAVTTRDGVTVVDFRDVGWVEARLGGVTAPPARSHHCAFVCFSQDQIFSCSEHEFFSVLYSNYYCI